MAKLVSNLVAGLLLLHAALGCNWRECLRCVECCSSTAVAAETQACCEHHSDEDGDHHESDGCGEHCDHNCIYIAAESPQLDQAATLVAILDVDQLLLHSQTSLVHYGVAQPKVSLGTSRLYLEYQILLI